MLIGLVYAQDLDNCSKALEYYERSLAIRKACYTGSYSSVAEVLVDVEEISIGP